MIPDDNENWNAQGPPHANGFLPINCPLGLWYLVYVLSTIAINEHVHRVASVQCKIRIERTLLMYSFWHQTLQGPRQHGP
jgi:hypothetical protein